MNMAKAVFSALIPGGFAFIRRRHLAGAAYLCIWILLAAAWALQKLLTGGAAGGAGKFIGPAVAVLYAASAAAAAAVFIRARRAPGVDQLDTVFREAISGFVAGDFDGVCEHLRRIMLRKPLDCDCLFLQAQTALAQGRKGRAKRLFRKCKDFDEEGKWAWEIKTALERL